MGVVLSAAMAAAHGQTLENDYARYLQPLVFMLPDAPAPIESNPSRKYVAKVDILADGTVKRPVTVDPAEPSMVAAVNDAARFWLFAPSLTGDCQAGPRSGRIGFEYDSPSGRAWIELPDLVVSGWNDMVEIVSRDEVAYPAYESRRHIDSGKVTVAVKILPDGTVGDASVFIAVPPTKGFVETALRGARSTVVKFNKPMTQPFICRLITYNFVIP